MKHQETKQYICPQSLVRDTPAYCLGNQCAAWRWSEPKWGSLDKRRGYCGLATEPKYALNPDNEA